MRRFGLIGGTSWYSTVEYYTLINQSINKHFGNNTNPPLYVANLNQKAIHDYQKANDWNSIAKLYIEKAHELQQLDVAGLAFCANTPHKIYDEVQRNCPVPVVHIADSIAKTAKDNRLSTVGLLGTRFTMQADFIKQRLQQGHGISTQVPEAEMQDQIQQFVYDELSEGVFLKSTQAFFIDLIKSLVRQGTQGVVLGCTEFPILLQGVTCDTLLIDSLQSHCAAIVDFILADDHP